MTEQRRIRRRAQIPSLAAPSMITLTKSPANRSGIKIMRSAAGAPEETMRSDDDLLAIDLPSGATEEEAERVLNNFSLSEDYEVSAQGAGWRLRRKGSDTDDEPRVGIPLNGGLIAQVRASAFQRSDAETEGKVVADDCKFQKTAYPSLTTLRFDTKVFPAIKDVQVWLERNDVSYEQNGVKVSPEMITVSRSQLKGDNTTVALADGVSGTVVRSDVADVPNKVYRSILEQAYGNWGWGHVDFAAALADPEFTDKSWDAIYALRDVLENIALYSGLPLDDRKVLIRNACNSYADYMERLIDLLPRAAIEQQRSDKESRQENADMTGKATQDKETDNKTPAEGAQEFVTRSELSDAIAVGVKAALDARDAVTTDTAKTDDKPAVETEQRSDKKEEADPVAKIASAVEGLTELVKGQVQRTDELTKELKALRSDGETQNETKVITRNDDGAKGEGQEAQGKTSVFSGLFDSATSRH